MFRRRRPLARAAMVGGAAYYAGKKGQQSHDRETEQEYRLQELEAQQGQPQQAQYAPPPVAQPGSADTLAQLQQLADLKERGVLTDEEFAAQKRQLLGG